MTAEQFEILLRIVNKQTLALERIADGVDRLAPNIAPNYTRSLEAFKNFDWQSIGATLEKSDQYGPAVVSWRDQQFIRRSPSNKFGEAIWFSRCIGKDDSGENRYERLITFKPLSIESVPDRLSRFV